MQRISFFSAELKGLRLFQKVCFLSMRNEHFSSEKPPHRCYSSGCWWDACSFTLLGVWRLQKTSQHLMWPHTPAHTITHTQEQSLAKTTNCSQADTWMRTTSMRMNLRTQFVQIFCGFANRLLKQQQQQLSRWLATADLGGKRALPPGAPLWGRCEVLPNSQKCFWRQFTVDKHPTHRQQLRRTFLPSARQMHAPWKLAISVPLCCVVKHSGFFFCGQPGAHLCNNSAV